MWCIPFFSWSTVLVIEYFAYASLISYDTAAGNYKSLYNWY